MVPLAVSVAGLLMQWATVCLLAAAVLIFDRHARSLVKASVSTGGGHPYVHARVDALLWSINERLAGRAGLDLGRMEHGYLSDVLEAAIWQNSAECPECGEYNRLMDEFCSHCGSVLRESHDTDGY